MSLVPFFVYHIYQKFLFFIYRFYCGLRGIDLFSARRMSRDTSKAVISLPKFSLFSFNCRVSLVFRSLCIYTTIFRYISFLFCIFGADLLFVRKKTAISNKVTWKSVIYLYILLGFLQCKKSQKFLQNCLNFDCSRLVSHFFSF